MTIFLRNRYSYSICNQTDVKNIRYRYIHNGYIVNAINTLCFFTTVYYIELGDLWWPVFKEFELGKLLIACMRVL